MLLSQVKLYSQTQKINAAEQQKSAIHTATAYYSELQFWICQMMETNLLTPKQFHAIIEQQSNNSWGLEVSFSGFQKCSLAEGIKKKNQITQYLLWITQILEKGFTTSLHLSWSLLQPPQTHTKECSCYKKFLYVFLKFQLMVHCTEQVKHIPTHNLSPLTIGRMHVSTSCGFPFRYDNV